MRYRKNMQGTRISSDRNWNYFKQCTAGFDDQKS